MNEYCCRVVDKNTEENVWHGHVVDVNEEQAAQQALRRAVAENVRVVGCVVAVARAYEPSEKLLFELEEVRAKRYGATTAQEQRQQQIVATVAAVIGVLEPGLTAEEAATRLEAALAGAREAVPAKPEDPDTCVGDAGYLH